ncbi:hypothetical protein OK348_07120 [Flavobacterium sp. MXW15]|uniref:Type IV pilus biogenesis protein PilP n=1 Tax=Xanthomonas chitinilytica TaxID=2989819 RepID=A0ABT3JTJ0_9XANT|nr:hypothetical protein [Xanthomonas sp. H13-6]MCW4454565.1 hypothetical protein [Flavobacterium sp. MXW15]MCW4471804.1 hypothetical protein [Xanthomonas sp. H13-6]
MKMKFTAAIALAVWLAVTGWLATMVIVKPAVLHLGIDADETAAMVELRAAIERNRQMQQRIAQLRQTGFSDDGRPLLALSPRPAAAGAGSLPAHVGGSAGEPVAHSVSVVLEANGRRSAIIDGRHVRTGTRLTDGSRVGAIGADWVRIESPDGERVVHPVPSPYQSAAGAVQ